jgi:hypothetical protein
VTPKQNEASKEGRINEHSVERRRPQARKIISRSAPLLAGLGEGLDKSIQDLPAHAASGACPDLSFAKSIACAIVSRAGHLEACGTSE